MSLPHTRAIIDAIHSGELAQAPKKTDSLFGFEVPLSCPNVPVEILSPRNTWQDGQAYDTKARHLAMLFRENFKKFEEGASPAIRDASPKG